jgi:PGF-pre-PGF domain-containing protein
MGLKQKSLVLVGLLIFLFFIIAIPVSAQPDAMFRYDATRSGNYTPVAGLTGTSVSQIWNVSFEPADGGFSTPTISNGIIYIGGGDRQLHALIATNGASLWNYTTAGGVSSTPAVSNDIVYVGSWDHNLTALDATTGALKWRYKTGSLIESSPVVSNGVVYVGSDDDYVYALNAATGAQIWSYQTGGKVQSSPAVANGVLYVGSDDGYVYALDTTNNGAFLWKCQAAPDSESALTVVNGVVYESGYSTFSSTYGSLYAINTTTQSVMWSNTSFKESAFASPAVVDNMVYLGNYDRIYAFNAITGNNLWTVNVGIPTETSSPVVANNVVYVGAEGFGDGSTVYALNAATGAQIWSFNTFSWNTASPTILYGVLYIPSGGYLGSDNLYALNLGASQPAPIFASATTNTAGTAINITFNKAMNNPSGDQGQFTYSINGGASQAFSAAALDSNPDVIDLTTSGTPIAYDNVVTVNYTAGSVKSTDNGVLATFSNQPVTNMVPGPTPTPPIFVSATTNTAGTAINITFNKAMNNPTGDQSQFTYSINGGAPQSFTAAVLDSNPDIIDLTTSGTPIAYGKVVTINYTAGTVTSSDNGVLATFNNRAVDNAMPVPTPTPTIYGGSSGIPVLPTPVGTVNVTGGIIETQATPTPTPLPTSIISVNVGGTTPIASVNVTGTGINGLIVTATEASGPGTNVSAAPGIVMEYMNITPQEFTSITDAQITFFISQSWIDENNLVPQDIVLEHNVGTGWQALPTTFDYTSNGEDYFTATTTGFSRFAITGQPGLNTVSQNAVPSPTVQTFGALAKASSTGSPSDPAPQVTSTPVKTQTTIITGTSQPLSGFPFKTIAIVAGCVVLVGSGFLVRRWWIRRQNPTLFRKLD